MKRGEIKEVSRRPGTNSDRAPADTTWTGGAKRRMRCHRACSAPSGAGDFWPWPQKSPKGPLRNAVSKNFPRAVACCLSLPCPTRSQIVVGHRSKVVCRLRSGPASASLPLPGNYAGHPAPLAGGHRGLAPAPAHEERAAAGASTLGVPLRSGWGRISRRAGPMCPAAVSPSVAGRTQGAAPTR